MQLSNRINVAMSRAKQVTIIVGNLGGLKKAKYWGTIVKEAEENGCVVEVNSNGASNSYQYSTRCPSANRTKRVPKNTPTWQPRQTEPHPELSPMYRHVYRQEPIQAYNPYPRVTNSPQNSSSNTIFYIVLGGCFIVFMIWCYSHSIEKPQGYRRQYY